jgi:hypothetical protein
VHSVEQQFYDLFEVIVIGPPAIVDANKKD